MWWYFTFFIGDAISRFFFQVKRNKNFFFHISRIIREKYRVALTNMDTLLHRYTRSHMNRGLGGCFKKMFSSTILFWSFINFNVLSGQIFEKKVNLGTVKKPWRLQNINRFSLWNYFAFWKSGSLLINTLLESLKLCPKNQFSEK